MFFSLIDTYEKYPYPVGRDGPSQFVSRRSGKRNICFKNSNRHEISPGACSVVVLAISFLHRRPSGNLTANFHRKRRKCYCYFSRKHLPSENLDIFLIIYIFNANLSKEEKSVILLPKLPSPLDFTYS